jgi:hypothetical protein
MCQSFSSNSRIAELAGEENEPADLRLRRRMTTTKGQGQEQANRKNKCGGSSLRSELITKKSG